MTIYTWIVIFFWALFIVYWAVSAPAAKKITYRDRRGELARYLGIVVIVLLVKFEPAAFTWRYGAYGNSAGLIGAILCAVGVSFAIWARWHLGKNWSYVPSIQEGHELVTSGPYRFVRHPIYTGMLFAMLGSALVTSAGWFVIFIFAGVTFVMRIFQEEKFMMQLFPDQYPEYKKRTKALIPFIW